MNSRRDMLVQTGSALAVLGLLGESTTRAETGKAPPGVPVGKHAVVPLPFDPKKLNGLSEAMIESHHDNNYAGAVRNLNKVEEDLARLQGGTAQGLPGGRTARTRARLCELRDPARILLRQPGRQRQVRRRDCEVAGNGPGRNRPLGRGVSRHRSESLRRQRLGGARLRFSHP